MKKHRAVITTNQGQEQSIEVEVIHLNVKARVVKSTQQFLLFLFLAAAAIMIPVAHFILVPALLLIAVILPLLNMKNDKALTAQNISCPKCKSKIHFKTKPFKTEVKNFCVSCHSQVKVIFIA
jgi:hypothetical protein